MKVNIKLLHNDAVIPKYSHDDDAGMDLTAVSTECKNNILTIHTGLAMEIPSGFVGLLFPRSSVYKKNLNLCNSVGVIDANYRGEVMGKFYVQDPETIYKVGERCLQMIILPYPKIEFNQVETLSETNRGQGGFGSTNNKGMNEKSNEKASEKTDEKTNKNPTPPQRPKGVYQCKWGTFESF